jgi:hypothetical protein
MAGRKTGLEPTKARSVGPNAFKPMSKGRDTPHAPAELRRIRNSHAAVTRRAPGPLEDFCRPAPASARIAGYSAEGWMSGLSRMPGKHV